MILNRPSCRTVILLTAVVIAAPFHLAGETGESLAESRTGTWTERVPFTDGESGTIHYYLFTPGALEPGEKYPMVVWLHGGVRSNGRGGPNMPMQAFYRPEHQQKQPCFVLRPVAIQGKNWVSPRGPGAASHQQPEEPAPSVTLLMKLIDRTLARHPIDPKQVHVVGASMGGYGTWDVITRYPDRFASAVPICGGADPSKAGRVRDVKIWAFHSADDRIVPARGSREMFAAAMRARGEKPIVEEDDRAIRYASRDGRIRYTEFKSGGHNAWDRALGSPELFSWVFDES